MHTREARRRAGWLPIGGLLLALVPSALADRPVPRAAPLARAPQAPAERDPNALALVPPDLLGDALRVSVAPHFGAEATPQAEPRAVALEQPTALERQLALHVPEPAAGWLALLSAASAAVASRGRRRCPRSQRRR